LKRDSLPAKDDESVYFGRPFERLDHSLPVKDDVLPVEDDDSVYFRRKTIYFCRSFERLHHSLVVKNNSSPVMSNATPVKDDRTAYLRRPFKRLYDQSVYFHGSCERKNGTSTVKQPVIQGDDCWFSFLFYSFAVRLQERSCRSYFLVAVLPADDYLSMQQR
jgi:hypothetical protein